MRRFLVSTLLALLLTGTAAAEIHTMTLRQALDTALAENPDVILARLDQQTATSNVELTRDPFTLKAGVGSGLAYTYGFPSINGQPPSIAQAQAQMAIFNRPQSYRVEQAREAQRGSAIDIELRQEEAVYQVYSAFLNAEQAARSTEAASQQIANLERVQQLISVRIEEGTERPIESRRAEVNVLRAQQALEDFSSAQTNAEIALAQLLGLPAGDQVRPAQEDRTALAMTATEQEAIAAAIADSKEIRRLESNIAAKQLEVKSYDAERLPKINLISQYQLLAKFNNFEEFYGRFQRHNAVIGTSIELPLFLGTAPKASKAIAETDIDRLQIQIDRTRSRIAGDLQRDYAEVRRAESARDLARADLDLAREDLSLLLIEYDEGVAPMAEVEAARATEQEKWLVYYDAQRVVELARLNVLRDSGSLLAALQ